MKVIERLTNAIRNAALYNSEVQDAPACILWTDSERQWLPVMARLQAELSELLMLGEYNPENRVGPAIWMRCVIARQLANLDLPADKIPILYLPGVSRQNLRAVENCPENLKPLAELQYRGVIWSQINAKDWTITTFLKSDQGGLNLDVALDNATKNAAGLALNRLLDEEVEILKTKRLDRDYFNSLLTGGDPIRDLLQWIDAESVFKSSRDENEWKAFVALIESKFNFNPQKEGVLAAAAKLAEREGAWTAVWERFSEAPRRYQHIPSQIRRCQPPNDTLIWQTCNADLYGGWAQWNEEQEKKLHDELITLADLPSHEARKKIKELETQHENRRTLVWAQLGEASLARALKYLAILAEKTEKSLAGGTIDELSERYDADGWKGDDAMLRALAEVGKQKDVEAVKIAVRTIYLSWLEESALYLQKITDSGAYPGGTIANQLQSAYQTGECIIFVDGLRFDAAKRLSEMIKNCGLDVAEKPKWAALPSVTATGKPAVSPVRNKICGLDDNSDFEPSVAATNQSLKGGYHLKKLLKSEDWRILDKSDNGDGNGNAWCEFGDIDHEGHDRGWKLAKHLDQLLNEICDRIKALTEAGWKRIHIVTDHGWLLLPGGLPKIELSSALTASKWGRCASIKKGADTNERLFPWFWNPAVHFALANGVSCFKAGEEYAHGGLSFQECLTLELFVTSKNTLPGKVVLTDIIWKGLRCSIAAEGITDGLLVDIRTSAGDSASSVIFSQKLLTENGTASVIVEDEDLEGQSATLVLTDKAGELILQKNIRIGGNKH